MKKKAISLLLSLAMIFSMSFSLAGIPVFADNVIEIRNIDDLYNVRNNMSGNYKLMCDIDMTDAVATGGKYNYQGKGWEPFGATTQTEFTGTLDGNGHSITGMSINGLVNTGSNDTNSNALFWTNTGTIKNLSVYGLIRVESGYCDGLIAGINNGCISNCVADGQIQKGYNVGLVSGKNTGTIEYCQSKGLISAIVNNAHTGGICGSASSGQITHCYNSADVTTFQYNYDGSVCGIVGHADSSVTIANCYNAGTITGSYYYYQSYGFSSYTTHYVTPIGIANGGTLSNCYNAGTLKRSQHINAGGGDDEIGGDPIGGNSRTNCYYLKADGISDSSSISLNETQMAMEQSFEGFDFENVWIIDPGADYKYPQLRSCRQDLGREIDMIELKSAPDKITYKTGDDFDPTGCVVTVLYKDNGSEDINVTADMLSGYDMSTPGIQDVKFSYRGYSLTFKINVNQRPEITGMELTSPPLKTTFIRGTEFDFTGAVAQIRYKDKTTEDFLIDAKDCTGGDINTSGEYTITYTKFGHSVTFDVSVVPVREEGIHIESLPDKLSYIEGEEIDTTGLVVNVDYNSGATAPIEDFTIAEYDNSAGVQTITVQYKDFEATFEVSFAEKKVLSIEITKQPNKTEYVFGQLFDPTGMIVTANLDNGKTEEVTDYVVSPMEDRNGMQDLTVSYAGKTTYVTVFVTQRALDSISVTTKPYKLTYIEGSEFDPEGMVVTAKYNDGSTEVITDYTMSKLGKTPGNKTIVISYNGKTTTLAVTVIAKTVVKLTVTAPDKVNYIKGEEFDPTGMVVTALYNDGTSGEVTDYRVAGFGESDEVNILEVSYGGKAETIVVTIHDPDDWKVVTKPTCTQPGKEARLCKECGEELETRELPQTDHTYGEWATVKAATCSESGTEERVCSKCDHKEKRSIPLIDHSLKKTAAKQATATSEGNIEYWTCNSCGKIFKDSAGKIEITIADTVIPKTSDEGGSANPDSGSNSGTNSGANNGNGSTAAANGAQDTKAIAEAIAQASNVNKATVSAADIRKASALGITSITLGKKVKKIKKNAFKGSGINTIIVKTKKLKKTSVKGSLKGSKVKTIKVKIGNKKINKQYVKKYKKIFTKKNAGKKAKVK